MSIEAAPQLTPQEVDTQIGHLEHQITGENIATIVDAVVTKVVPNSVEMAEQVVDRLEVLDAAVRQDTSANPDLKAELGEEYVEDLHQTALKGLDNWRLSKAERSEWAQVVGSHSHHLSPKMRSIMHDLSPENSNETDTQMFARLRRQAHDRLKLDAALEAKYGNDDHARPVETAAADPAAETPKYRQLPALGEKPTFDQRVYKNNAKHIYAIDENGKKHHVSADSILAAYGHAGDYQGKRPKHEASIPVTQENAAGRHIDTFVRPADFPAEKWDELDTVAKRIVMRVAAERAAKAAELAMPADFGNEDRWATLSDDQKRKVIRLAEAQKAKQALTKQAAALVKPATVTQEAWDAMDSIQKRIEIRVAPEKAKKAAELLMPADFKNDARWSGLTDDKKRLVIAIAKKRAAEEAAQAASATPAKPEVRTIRISKKILAGAVAGALLLSAAVGKWGMSEHESPVRAATTQTQPAKPPVKPVAPKHVVKHEVAGPASIHLKRGDTPWHEAEMILARQGINHPSNAQIDKVTDHLRTINGHMTKEQAKHLPVGYTLKLR
jgi:hypothetical protein